MSQAARRCGAGRDPSLAGKWSMAAAGEPLGGRRSGPEDDPVLELRRLHQTSSLNRFYVPISGLPPLGPDPRRGLGDKAPSCYPKPALSRAERLLQKWQSIPTHRPQLPSIDFPDLPKDDFLPPPELDGEVAKTVERARHRRKETRSRFCEQRSTKDGHEFPHIPCSCCSRTTPRPFPSTQTASTQWASAQPSAQASARAPEDAAGPDSWRQPRAESP